LYQQLHNYPVGASGRGRRDDAKGGKYNITPVRREFLADLRAYVCFDFIEEPEIEDTIRHCLTGLPLKTGARYGLPFLGDNAFLIDRLELREEPVMALWYRRLTSGAEIGLVARSARLTIWIDRADFSKTKSAVFVPDDVPVEDSQDPDWTAWTLIQPPQAPAAPARPSRRKR
jgi:CRISPR-associated protein Cas5t